jgi:hypothetical protein
VQVNADNVNVGTTPINWQGKVDESGSCQGTWQMTVPTAHAGYEVTAVVVCDTYTVPSPDDPLGSTNISVLNAGNPVDLTDASNEPNC